MLYLILDATFPISDPIRIMTSSHVVWFASSK